MRCLSIRQPWASLIESGRKTVELRSWSTNYRGPLLVLAGARPAAGDVGWPKDGPRGVALCIVDIADVRHATQEDTAAACTTPPDGSFAWVLANPRPVKRVPVKGRLSLYEPDAALLEAVGAR